MSRTKVATVCFAREVGVDRDLVAMGGPVESGLSETCPVPAGWTVIEQHNLPRQRQQLL